MDTQSINFAVKNFLYLEKLPITAVNRPESTSIQVFLITKHLREADSTSNLELSRIFRYSCSAATLRSSSPDFVQLGAENRTFWTRTSWESVQRTQKTPCPTSV